MSCPLEKGVRLRIEKCLRAESERSAYEVDAGSLRAGILLARGWCRQQMSVVCVSLQSKLLRGFSLPH